MPKARRKSRISFPRVILNPPGGRTVRMRLGRTGSPERRKTVRRGAEFRRTARRAGMNRREPANRRDRAKNLGCGHFSTGTGIPHLRRMRFPPRLPASPFALLHLYADGGQIRRRGFARAESRFISIQMILSCAAGKKRNASLARLPDRPGDHVDMRARIASNSSTVAAIAAFSDSARPRMGIRTHSSSRAAASGDSPSDSLPRRSQTPPLQSHS